MSVIGNNHVLSRPPSLREQVEAALRQDRLNPNLPQERAKSMRRTHGVLDERDGEIFEQALRDSRRNSNALADFRDLV